MERPILFINACVRKESRTMRLAEKLLSRLNQPYKEVILHEFPFPVTDEEFLNIRNQLISDRDFSNPMFELARQFAEAETIVIAAPYWDLSFPATLKQYFEYINVLGITFEYTDDGYPIGLCKADKIYYVTTAGGQFIPEEFGFGYVKALAENFYGIPDVREIEATGLDIEGADADSIMRAAEASIDEMNLE
ncbi:MAG: NAD(P)H-dependent oxidoreductase [Solobacterium sp.]|nr:NAD(P)H-dependent oxidoreductase [Solobacterium sp.]MBR2670455.1 NAD(P)H-dependent oxidoreductase [Solobacterium sp.]